MLMTDLDTHTKDDTLRDTADAPAVAAEEPNPWSSSTSLRYIQPDMDQKSATVHVASFDSEAAVGSTLQPTEPKSPVAEEKVEAEPAADASVLREFDPLVSDPVEKNAQDAWATAESHPPPPPAKDLSVEDASSTTSAHPPRGPTPPPAQPVQQPASPVPQSAPATSSTFPSLASLARTLTLSPRRANTPPLPPPPRSSSLRHSHHTSISSIPSSPASPGYAALPQVSDKVPSDREIEENASKEDSASSSDATMATADGVTISTSPKPDGQFDFQKFLDQMKTKGADPIAKYLRSFLSNFAKKTFAVNDQIKIIHDFLDFISEKMRAMDGSPWQNAPPQDFDNAMEAMEKLVMNRLYEFTFQPLLPPSLRTTDDLERDHVLRQRISLFEWLREEHLDVPTGGKEVRGFLEFAQQELLKINHYKAPRDKLICILNCCKVIFGLIRHVQMTEGADSFIPILIFVVLKANPEHLLSNVEYINRFRSPSKLQSEAGYYLSSLMGAVSFIETMDHSSLSNISQEEFEQNVEAAIQLLPITRTPSPTVAAPSTPAPPRPPRIPNIPNPDMSVRSSPSPLAGEEAARPLSLPMPSSDVSADGNPSISQVADDTRRFFQRTSDSIISKPLAAIGRIFSDVLDGPEAGPGSTSRPAESGIGPQDGDEHGERKMGWRDLPGPFAPLSVGAGGSQAPQTPHWSHPDQTRQYQQAPHTPLGDGSYQPPIQTPYKPRVRPAYSNTSSPANSYTYAGSQAGTPGPPMTKQPLAMGPSQAYRPSPPRASRPDRLQAGAGSPHPSRNPTPTLDFGALQDEIDRAHLAAQDAARETLMQIFPAVDREVAEMVLEANDGDLGKSIEGLLEISGGHSAGVVA